MFRIGQGYDIHVFEKSRPLIIGGEVLRDHDGLLGHSDADVLVHAIMDALLGAAGLRDIGYYFPDTDPKYKGISSIKLLKEVKKKLDEAGYIIGNIDSTVIAEEPKLNPHIEKMKANIGAALDIDQSQIAIKATTKEKMDASGQGLSIEALAIAMIKKD